jgi:hypothetical protein
LETEAHADYYRKKLSKDEEAHVESDDCLCEKQHHVQEAMIESFLPAKDIDNLSRTQSLENSAMLAFA